MVRFTIVLIPLCLVLTITATGHAVEEDSAMTITSPAFDSGQRIPTHYTGEGQDVSPPLQWSDPPDGVKQFALIVDDPDAPTAEPWVHWVIYSLPPNLTSLPEAVPRDAQLTDPPGAMQGLNSWPSNNVGYRGPMPPPGHGMHHYYFTLYALDQALDLEPRMTKAELLRAIDGHVLETAELIGTYER